MEANQGTPDGHERFVDVIPAFVSNSESTELMKPCNGSLHHPPELPQSTAVLGPALGQERLDPSPSQILPQRFRIVRAIPIQTFWSLPRSAGLAHDRRNRLDQRDGLSHIMPIGTGQFEGQGETVALGKEVMLAPQFPSIRRVRARFFPPPTARTEPESIMARDQSIWSAQLSMARRV